ncbi:MAG: hypothetical protein FJ265_05350 [Planctomycetes bacterium]|nr:hypothetical protein [Planctomycetota bacterium]
MQDVPCRRRRFVVDRQLQWSLCAHALALGVFVLAATSLGIFLPLLWDLGSAGAARASAEPAIVMLYMHERFWIVAAVSLALFALGVLRLSHRIAGPLVRFKRDLRLLAAGRLPPPLRTRRRDYLKQEVECLNAAVAGVRERVAAIAAANAEVQRALLGAVDRLPPAAHGALAPAVAAQRAVAERLGAFTETGEIDAGPVPTGRLVAAAEGC